VTITLARAGSLCVFAPSPLLVVYLEPAEAADGDADIHLHVGGQGYWMANLAAELGVRVTVCATFGGEAGRVLLGLLDGAPVHVRAVATASGNRTAVEDRRGGEAIVLAATAPVELSRHEVDDLYGVALVEGIEADVTILGGPGDTAILPSETYQRLATDLVGNGTTVIADLSGADLDAAVAGHATVVKCSHEELLRDGRAEDDSMPALFAAMEELATAGAEAVVCSRQDQPALALYDGRRLRVHGPSLQAMNSAGAGDSFTAGLAAGLAAGRSFADALRLGAAAGTLNVTRRGLGTGSRPEIERLAGHVRIEEHDPLEVP
jgi:1-phosphofructokinase